MSKFKEKNFRQILAATEEYEHQGNSPWIVVSVLEMMYDDDAGYIDEYFSLPYGLRDTDELVKRIFFTN